MHQDHPSVNDPYLNSLAALGGDVSEPFNDSPQILSRGGAAPSRLPPLPLPNGVSPSESATSFHTSHSRKQDFADASGNSSRSPSVPPALASQQNNTPSIALASTANGTGQLGIDPSQLTTQSTVATNLGRIGGAHVLKDRSVFNLAVGETFVGRRNFQRKLQEVAVKHNFRITVFRSSVLSSKGPCPVDGTLQFGCSKGERQLLVKRGTNCSFSVELSFVLERDGMNEDDITFKITSIVDEHNHRFTPLTARDLVVAARTLAGRKISSRGSRHRRSDLNIVDEDEQEAGNSSEEEVILSRGSSTRRAPAQSQSRPIDAQTNKGNSRSSSVADWRPPAKWFKPTTRNEIISDFPREVLQSTGVEVVRLDAGQDLSFICKLRQGKQCSWKAVFGQLPTFHEEADVLYQLLGTGYKRSFSHSHLLEPTPSHTPLQSPSESTANIASRQEVDVSSISNHRASQPGGSNASTSRHQTLIAPNSPLSNRRAVGFATSSSGEDIKPALQLLESKKRARPVPLPQPSPAQPPSVNLGMIILSDSDEEEDVKPAFAEESEEGRRHKQARIVAPPSSDEQVLGHSRANPAVGLAPPPAGVVRAPQFPSNADSTAQRQLETFLLSIDPEFIVSTTSPSNELKLDFLAPLLLGNRGLPNTPADILYLQPRDAQLLAMPLREAYEIGDEGEKTLGKIRDFDWVRIVDRLSSFLTRG